jgi:hypothetical protein
LSEGVNKCVRARTCVHVRTTWRRLRRKSARGSPCLRLLSPRR